MNDVSPGHSSLEGFRVLRSNLPSVALWTAIYILSAALSLGVVALLLGSDIQRLVTTYWGVTNMTPELGADLIALAAKAIFAFVLAMFIALFFAAVREAALMRSILRPEDKGFGYLRVGPDEFRILIVMVVLALLTMTLFAVSAGALFLVARATGPLGVLIAALGIPALLVGYVFLAVKFSLAVPQSFAEGRIDVFGSWGMTTGRFWPLVGTYLIAWVIGVGISIVGGQVLQLVLGMNTYALQFEAADFDFVDPVFIVRASIYMVLSIIMSTMIFVVMGAPKASVYLAINPRSAEVF